MNDSDLFFRLVAASNQKASKTKVRYINKSKQDVRVRKAGRKPKNVETNDKGPFKCGQCDKVFDKWVSLKKHETAHDKKYNCENCDASYSILVSILLNHCNYNALLKKH